MKHWLSRRTSKAAQGIPTKIKDHVIIVGYGLKGRNLARVLGDIEIPYVVLDVNPDAVKAPVKDRGQMIYGDATNPRVLTLKPASCSRGCLWSLPLTPLERHELSSKLDN